MQANNKSIVTVLTGNDEWSTPTSILELSRRVLGRIDTDPASNDLAQKNVKAVTYYTKDDDGLSKPWMGNLWLNPPYSRGMMSRFTSKLLGEIRAGNTKRAIVLTSAATDTKWFHSLATNSNAYCLTRGRIKFLQQDGSEGKSPPHGHAFFYFGDNPSEFCSVFRSVGLVSVPEPMSFM